jgi:heterotetrameric sarcosine oxidase delta subunit
MSFLLPCPTCGPRPVDEYSYGGEVTVRPGSSDDERGLFSYLYFRTNAAGPQREWWFHASGCREWFQAERDTRTNEVLAVARPEALSARETPEPPASRPDADSGAVNA